MTFWFRLLYYQVLLIRKWPILMTIHHYERAFLLEKYAHNVTQHGDKNYIYIYIYSPMMMSSQHHILQKNKNSLSSNDVC